MTSIRHRHKLLYLTFYNFRRAIAGSATKICKIGIIDYSASDCQRTKNAAENRHYYALLSRRLNNRIKHFGVTEENDSEAHSKKQYAHAKDPPAGVHDVLNVVGDLIVHLVRHANGEDSRVLCQAKIGSSCDGRLLSGREVSRHA